MLDKMVVHNATILRSLPNFVDPSSFLRDLCKHGSLFYFSFHNLTSEKVRGRLAEIESNLIDHRITNWRSLDEEENDLEQGLPPLGWNRGVYGGLDPRLGHMDV